jgi:hypothetical protein
VVRLAPPGDVLWADRAQPRAIVTGLGIARAPAVLPDRLRRVALGFVCASAALLAMSWPAAVAATPPGAATETRWIAESVTTALGWLGMELKSDKPAASSRD